MFLALACGMPNYHDIAFLEIDIHVPIATELVHNVDELLQFLWRFCQNNHIISVEEAA